MKVRFTEVAFRDLADIAAYISAHNPKAALRVEAAILDSIKSLSDFPSIGREQHEENVRKLTVPRYYYRIYYAVDAPNDEVVVLTVRHHSRRAFASDK